MTTDHQIAEAVQRVNARNARTVTRCDAAASFVVAMVVAILGALAMLHWAMPCDPAGTLCLGAFIVRTRRGPLTWAERHLVRISCRLRVLYLRALIGAAENDLRHMDDAMRHLPLQAEYHRLHVEALRLRIASIELDSRRC